MSKGHDEVQMCKRVALPIVNRIKTRRLTGANLSQARQVTDTEGLHGIDNLSLCFTVLRRTTGYRAQQIEAYT